MNELEELNLQELQAFSDRVGVGYKNLDADQLRTKLMSEGAPV